MVEPEDRSGDFRLRLGLSQGFERPLLTADGAAAATGERTGSIAIDRSGTLYRVEFTLEVRTGSLEDDDERLALRSERRGGAGLKPAAQVPEGRGGERLAASMLLHPVLPLLLRRAPSGATCPCPSTLLPESARDDTSWDDDEVEALLALLVQQVTAAPGNAGLLPREAAPLG